MRAEASEIVEAEGELRGAQFLDEQVPPDTALV